MSRDELAKLIERNVLVRLENAEDDETLTRIARDVASYVLDDLDERGVLPSGWRTIDSAPKTKADFTGGTADFLAWCPDPDAPQGGDRRIVWWEPQMKGGKGCWWGDRELEEHPTLWMPLPAQPTAQPA